MHLKQISLINILSFHKSNQVMNGDWIEKPKKSVCVYVSGAHNGSVCFQIKSTVYGGDITMRRIKENNMGVLDSEKTERESQKKKK